MLTKKNTIDKVIFDDFNHFFIPEEACFFDIETTGFSVEHTTLYLIGCCFITDKKLYTVQWFNDDGQSEQQLLEAFMAFVSRYKYLLHYNGDGFDIPYITKKSSNYSIHNTLPALISIDLYKKIKPFKKILHLDNLKLKSIEQFLGLNRNDIYSGKELIKVYLDYQKSSDTRACDTLFLHNYEDVIGLVECFKMLTYSILLTGDYSLSKLYTKDNHLCFELNLSVNIPKRIMYVNKAISLSVYKNQATLSVLIIEATLKYYYDNYHDYYYLPKEDVAIHKSVATYIDKTQRTKATRATCYNKRNGFFITKYCTNDASGFKYDYNDKASYIELNDDFLSDSKQLLDYVKQMLPNIIL